MKLEEALETVLHSYQAYYTIKRNDGQTDFPADFSALAEFHSHSEQYFLVKAAKVADIDSNEYVFFALFPRLTKEKVRELSELAWSEGLRRVKAGSGHRSSDVSLIILCSTADDEAMAQIKKMRKYKSYFFTIYGWSHFRLFARVVDYKTSVCNRMGGNIKKLFEGIKI